MIKKLYYIVPIFYAVLIPLILSAESEDAKKTKEQSVEKPSLQDVKEDFVETLHEVQINGQLIKYKAIAGNLLLKNDKGEPKASIFYISYTREGIEDNSQRPLTFCFNGGPGSSSIWLHLGVLGPKRVQLTERGDALPPYHSIDNEFSILDLTDLVFIDPVSTGFSQAIPADDAKRYHGVEEDIKSVANFIRLYITRANRWDSPKFLAGESYGTTRAAGLAGYLHDNEYLYLNGVILISAALNFQTIDFSAGNDLAYLAFLPSYTAAAWYHKRLSPDLQKNLFQAINESRDFVINQYAQALFKGDLLTPPEKRQIVENLSRYTGLSPQFIEQNNLRIDMSRFSKELLKNQRRTIGRFDARYIGIDADTGSDHCEYDPSADAIFGAFTATLNHYLFTDLKWTKDQPYKVLANVNPWDYSSVATNQYLNVTDTLRNVMIRNPRLYVFVANGYYDLATPFFATEYTFNHLGLDPSLLNHVTMGYYEAGHMMYLHRPSLIQLKKDLVNYYRNTLQNQKVENVEEVSQTKKP